MYILGNPILGMNFRHHNKHLKLTHEGLFYMVMFKDQTEDVLMTSDPKVILDLMWMDSETEYTEDNDLYFMQELERSERFYRTLFLSCAKRPPFSELRFVQLMREYLEAPDTLITQRVTERLTDLDLLDIFPHLPTAIQYAEDYLRYRYATYRGVSGVNMLKFFPEISGPDIGKAFDKWKAIDPHYQVQIYLTYPLRDICKELLFGGHFIKEIKQVENDI